MRLKTLETQKEKLLDLIDFAQTMGCLDNSSKDPTLLEFLEQVERLRKSNGDEQALREKVVTVTRMAQKVITLNTFTLVQASAFLGVAYRTAQDAHYQGRLPAVKAGHDLMVSREAVLAFHETRRYRLG